MSRPSLFATHRDASDPRVVSFNLPAKTFDILDDIAVSYGIKSPGMLLKQIAKVIAEKPELVGELLGKATIEAEHADWGDGPRT